MTTDQNTLEQDERLEMTDGEGARREAAAIKRRNLGYALIAGGLLPWFGLMAYIVAYNNKPGYGLIAATFACWGVFFVGKSLLKSAGSAGWKRGED